MLKKKKKKTIAYEIVHFIYISKAYDSEFKV